MLRTSIFDLDSQKALGETPEIPVNIEALEQIIFGNEVILEHDGNWIAKTPRCKYPTAVWKAKLIALFPEFELIDAIKILNNKIKTYNPHETEDKFAFAQM